MSETWTRRETVARRGRPRDQRSERSTAIIVVVLTLACTALSLFDLLLLASHMAA